mmetsp:Transcript_4966/g.7271  ORF Transcript_4966/g.7271 Transcript_4966/m.7271 type:complete len:130 (-) Transcript_4966:237-626(-)
MSEEAVLSANQTLLNAITQGDYEIYKQLVSSDATCFEDESAGHLVEGLEFHKFYFDLDGPPTGEPSPNKAHMAAKPHVRMLGENAAVCSYVRVNQKVGGDGVPVTTTALETRVWECKEGSWVNVHVHRS